MKVKVYLPEDVPDGFKYGTITNDYVELFNKSSFQGETATFYRIYYNYNGGVVQTGTRSFSSYSPTYYSEIPVSRDILDYPKADSLVIMVFIFVIGFIWLTNLFTSIIKKGGLFGGLI